MILLLLLAKLPRRPRRYAGWTISAIGLLVIVAGLFVGLSVVIDGGIVLACGLMLLLSLRVDPERFRARIAALRAR